MKRWKLFSAIGMLAATLALSITGCTQPETPADAPQVLSVRFDANAVTCKNGAQTVSPNAAFAEGTKLTFTAKLPAGKTVEQWTVNGVTQTDAAGTVFRYELRASDAKSEGGKKIIAVAFTEKAAEKITVRFDANAVTCKNGAQTVSPNAAFAEGTKLTFTAKLPAGKTVEQWTVNGVTQEDATDATFTYELKAADAKSDGGKKTVTVAFTQKDAPPRLIIAFDAEKIRCFAVNIGKTIASGSEIKDGDILQFSAKLKTGTAVERWTVNGADAAEASGTNFAYTVKASDAKAEGGQKIIAIAFTEKTAAKLSVRFDGKKIRCSQSDGVTVNSGDELDEGAVLYFQAQLAAGKSVKDWLLNGAAQQTLSGSPYFEYALKASDAKDADGKKVITVDFVEKAAEKIIVRFDESKIQCSIYKDNAPKVHTGDAIDEGSILSFYAPRSDGKVIQDWLLNGTVQTSAAGKAYFSYILKPSDAKDEGGKKTITVAITEKAPEKIVIRFDESKISCLQHNNSELHSGEELDEGTRVRFQAQLEEGNTVKNWLVNGNVQEDDAGRPTFSYQLTASDAKDENGKKVITVDFTENEAENAPQKITVRFDENKISCFRQNGSKVSSGARLPEGTIVGFTATLESGKSVDNWIFNGTPRAEYTRRTHISPYTLKLSDAKDENGKKVLDIAITEKVQEKITVQFDENKIGCYISSEEGSITIKSGSERVEGEVLIFDVRLEKDKTAAYWIVSGAKQQNSAGSDFFYAISSADAKDEGGKKVITIDFVEKAAEKIVIRFDESKIKCFDGTYFASGKEQLEGDVFSIQAKVPTGKGVDRWLFNGTEKPHVEGETFFWYSIKASDAKDENGKKVIEITFTEKTLASIIVRFDSATINARLVKIGQPVNDGDARYEGESIVFSTVLKDFEWRVNGKRAPRSALTELRYTLSKNDAKKTENGLEITVSCINKK